MKAIVYVFGAFLVIAGILLSIDENIVLDYILSRRESSWLYFFAIVMRIIMGGALLQTASISRFPLAFLVIGGITLAAALIFLVIGHEQFQHTLSTILPYFEDSGIWTGMISIAFGAFLIYGITKRKHTDLPAKAA